MSRTGTDQERGFVEENFWWLSNWFRRTMTHNCPVVTYDWEGAPATNLMQIFKTVSYPCHPGDEGVIHRHMKEILLASVFGLGEEGEIAGRPYRYMNGYVPLFGTEPVPEDKVGFWTLGSSRWFQFRRLDEYDITKGIEVISECCIRPEPGPVMKESDLVHSINHISHCPIAKRTMIPASVVKVDSVHSSGRDWRLLTCPYCMKVENVI